VARAVGEACVTLHLADEQVCREITELFRDDFLRALEQSLLWPTEACGVLVGPSCGKFDMYAPWNITLPKVRKPPVTPPVLPKPGSPQSRVLFLTDVHWDKVGVVERLDQFKWTNHNTASDGFSCIQAHYFLQTSPHALLPQGQIQENIPADGFEALQQITSCQIIVQ